MFSASPIMITFRPPQKQKKNAKNKHIGNWNEYEPRTHTTYFFVPFFGFLNDFLEEITG